MFSGRLLLSTVFSRFIRVAACDEAHSFPLSTAERHSMVWTGRVVLLPSAAAGHLSGCYE